ncbi:MAG TPA: DUF6256 family protein [Actinomycetota bacterium]
MSRILREVVPPLLTIYVVVVAMLASLRRGWPPRRFERPLREVAVTIMLGYGAFLLIVLVFMTWATGDESALPDAVWEGAALLGIAVPAFVALSAVDAFRRRR